MKNWVYRLNKLCRQMDEITNSIHPTAWHETELVELSATWRALINAPIQETLFELEESDGADKFR